jgi:hypothetical protein
MSFIAPMFAGPIDVVGDIHGEIDALTDLTAHLGYNAEGVHPDGRRLVFVGDLIDRGPDSPAVLKAVMRLVSAGRAQCILGNHELNVLRDENKHGNDWWTEPGKKPEHPATPVDPADVEAMTTFLRSLPVALERDDLRVAHACWHDGSIAALRARNTDDLTVEALHDEYATRVEERWRDQAQRQQLATEWRDCGRHLTERDWSPVVMPVQAKFDREYQMENPVRVVTSGVEHETDQPFWAGGKWRMLDRIKWWEDYTDPTPVIVGHYWRQFSKARTVFDDKFGPDLFAGIEPHHFMGPRNNVYCADFSVGGRYAQRAENAPAHVCSLAAVRVPEWTVVHDNGQVWNIEP